jgi:hypothetical protein
LDGTDSFQIYTSEFFDTSSIFIYLDSVAEELCSFGEVMLFWFFIVLISLLQSMHLLGWLSLPVLYFCPHSEPSSLQGQIEFIIARESLVQDREKMVDR